MTERERLMDALFGNPTREHIDVKFFVGPAVDVSSEDFCRQAANMFAQMDASTEGDETFAETFTDKAVSELWPLH